MYVPVGSFLSGGIKKCKGPELITYRCVQGTRGPVCLEREK